MEQKNGKTKRIKRVFTNGAQVLHLWANQSQSDARTRNLCFEGLKAYSYGSHYELGRLVEFNGVRVALVNDHGWSTTTNKHIYWAYDAASHMPRFKTKDLYCSRGKRGDVPTKRLVLEAVIRRQGELIDSLFNEFNRRRYYSGAVEFNYVAGKLDVHGYDQTEYIVKQVREFNQSCHTLGLGQYALDINWAEYADLYKEHVSICLAKAELSKSPEALAKREKQREQREQAKIRKAAKDVQAWRDGGPLLDTVRNLGRTLIRIRGNVVESSRGASVPLPDALKLLRDIQTNKAEAGDAVGSFQFSRATDSEVVVGCHTIPMTEVLSVLGGLKAVSNE